MASLFLAGVSLKAPSSSATPIRRRKYSPKNTSFALTLSGTNRKISKTCAVDAGAYENSEASYDGYKLVKEFYDSKVGVKGLLDTGLISIPRFFHHPPEYLADPSSLLKFKPDFPVIDISGDRSTVIEHIRQASSTLGFFQIINHGIPQSTLDALIFSIKSFNEQSTEFKSEYYNRCTITGRTYPSDSEYLESESANWRDTLEIALAPTPAELSYVPEVLQSPVKEWDNAMIKIGEVVLELMSEGLGLEKHKLKDLLGLGWRRIVGHYYPYCPQPDLTMGLCSHTDPCVMTVLVQNEISGLQVKFGDNSWADMVHVSGALVVFVGDRLQNLYFWTMIDLSQGADTNNLSSSPQAYWVSKNSISSRKEFSFWGGNGTRKCENDDDPEKTQIEFQTQTGDYSAYSPPFWTSSRDTNSNLLQHNHRYSSPSRLQVIQDGKRELMKMVKGLPESSYELSLKDIVDDKMIPEIQQDVEKKIERKNVQNSVKRQSQSMNSDVFLLKMFIPSCLCCKKKSTLGDRSKVSQMSSFDGYEKTIDKEWWSVSYLIPRKNRSNSSGSSSSSSRSSSGSTSYNCSSGSRNIQGSFTPGCWSSDNLCKPKGHRGCLF